MGASEGKEIAAAFKLVQPGPVTNHFHKSEGVSVLLLSEPEQEIILNSKNRQKYIVAQ